MTPYEAWHGRAPSVAHLRVFGCVAYTHDLGQLRKLDDRGVPGIFIGYAEGTKAYRVFDPTSGRVKTSRDVIFDERCGWNWTTPAAGSSAAASSDFDIEWPAEAEEISASAPTSPSPPRALSSAPGEHERDNADEPKTPGAGSTTPAAAVEIGDPVDAWHDDEPLRYRTVANIIGNVSTPPPPPRLFAEVHRTHAGEPANFD